MRSKASIVALLAVTALAVAVGYLLGTGSEMEAQASACWLVEGIYPMEDIMKGVYERGGVGDLYEQQVAVQP